METAEKLPEIGACLLRCFSDDPPLSRPDTAWERRTENGEAFDWSSFRGRAAWTLSRVGAASLWQERGSPGLAGYQVTFVPGGRFLWQDSTRIVHTPGGALLTRRGVRTCDRWSDEAGATYERHLLGVTYPDQQIAEQRLDDLDACLANVFWTMATIEARDPDNVTVSESDSALVEGLRDGKYHAVVLHPYEYDYGIGGRRAVIDCLRAAGIPKPQD